MNQGEKGAGIDLFHHISIFPDSLAVVLNSLPVNGDVGSKTTSVANSRYQEFILT